MSPEDAEHGVTAVAHVDECAGLVAVWVVELQGPEVVEEVLRVVGIARRVDEGAEAVAVIIDADGDTAGLGAAEGAGGHGPQRHRVFGGRRNVGILAHPPARQCLLRIVGFGEQRGPPVVGRAAGVAPAVYEHHREGRFVGGVKVVAGSGGHLRVGPAFDHVATPGHHEGGQRPGGRAVLHHDGGRAGIVEVVALLGTGHGTEVAIAHGLIAHQRIPAALVGAAHVAGDEVGLHGAARAYGTARPQAAVHVVALTPLEQHGPVGSTVGVHVDGHAGMVEAGHHGQARIVEVAAVGGLTQRNGVGGAPVARRVHLVRAAEQRGRAVGPARLGHRHRKIAPQPVAAVEVDDLLEASGIHVVFQHNGGGGQDNVGGQARRRAVEHVTVAPNLGGGLLRIGQLDLVAVFPMVVENNSAVRNGRYADVGEERRVRLGHARRMAAGGVARVHAPEGGEQLILRHGQVKFLHDGHEAGGAGTFRVGVIDEAVAIVVQAVVANFHGLGGER